jgi:uncharacterized protein HemX
MPEQKPKRSTPSTRKLLNVLVAAGMALGGAALARAQEKPAPSDQKTSAPSDQGDQSKDKEKEQQAKKKAEAEKKEKEKKKKQEEDQKKAQDEGGGVKGW